MPVTVNGIVLEFAPGERLIDVVNRAAGRTDDGRDGNQLPQVCYHPQLGPIQTCDTCMVEADGKLVRACATQAADGHAAWTRDRARTRLRSARPSTGF